MSTQTLLGQSFPTPCKRCGGALYREVDYCPYCGAAHPLDAGPHKRVVIPGSRASAMNKPPRNNIDTPTTATADTAAPVAQKSAASVAPELPTPFLASPDAPIAPLAEHPHWIGPGGLTVRKVLLAIVAIVAIGLAFVGYQLFGDDHDLQSRDTEQNDTTQDARTTTGTIAPYAPAQTTQAARPQSAQPANQNAAANPAIAAKPGASTSNTLLLPIAPQMAAPAPAKPVLPPTPQFRDAAQALQTARQAIRNNDISTAQAALAATQALQPGNADAQSLLNDLKPLAARRDAALQAAQTCAAQQAWPCARQHANEALSIDTGNAAAKSILERVIRETGWAPLNSHAAAGVATQTASHAASQPPTSIPQPNGAQATAPHAGATVADANSAEARARAIRDSGWSRPSASGAKSPATAKASQ
ncbi:hypothetical protein PQQ51_10240 [Paraburkholderia xenovorans]|uniref:hypothetical protein n=1 Tax=Paraburkholderia xenovorans TaxID=36873 RepID=UPI0038B896ED